MLCRAPTSSATCSSTLTGAQLSYDNEGRLTAWQNAPGSTPTSSTSDLYDGEGHRVEQQITIGSWVRERVGGVALHLARSHPGEPL